MTHQPKNINNNNKERISGNGRNKQNNFLKLSLPGSLPIVLVQNYIECLLNNFRIGTSS